VPVDAQRYYDIVLSPIVRVLAVGQVVEAAGITVELLAIEVRETGALLYWRAHPPQNIVLMDAIVSMSDDAGSLYHVRPAQSSGSALRWEGQSLVIPAPPAGARIDIVLERFGGPSGRPIALDIPEQPIHGRWRFEVEQRDA
jgi:hypothetical protein